MLGNAVLFIESAAVQSAECAASLPLTAQKRRRVRWYCAKKKSQEKVARFVSMYILWKKATKRVWKLLNIVLKSHSCVWYLWLSSCSTASVSELSRLTHTAVPSLQCNSEKRPLSNSVTFRTLFKRHRYCSILKIHIIRKINTSIRYEQLYSPALHWGHL